MSILPGELSAVENHMERPSILSAQSSVLPDEVNALHPPAPKIEKPAIPASACRLVMFVLRIMLFIAFFL